MKEYWLFAPPEPILSQNFETRASVLLCCRGHSLLGSQIGDIWKRHRELCFSPLPYKACWKLTYRSNLIDPCLTQGRPLWCAPGCPAVHLGTPGWKGQRVILADGMKDFCPICSFSCTQSFYITLLIERQSRRDKQTWAMRSEQRVSRLFLGSKKGAPFPFLALRYSQVKDAAWSKHSGCYKFTLKTQKAPRGDNLKMSTPCSGRANC